VNTTQYIYYLTIILPHQTVREKSQERQINNLVEAKLKDFIYETEMAKKMITVVYINKNQIYHLLPHRVTH